MQRLQQHSKHNKGKELPIPLSTQISSPTISILVNMHGSCLCWQYVSWALALPTILWVIIYAGKLDKDLTEI
jgi:hypothetical protein